MKSSRLLLLALISIVIGWCALIPDSHSAPVQSKITNWMRNARKAYVEKRNATKMDDPDSLTELGVESRKLGLDGAAQAAFHKALKINPNHEKARAAAGYVKQGDSWVRDYMPLAKKITVTYQGGAGKAFKSFLDDPKNLADILKQIDERGGLYRGPEDVDIRITLKGSASGVGVTMPVSSMDDKHPPPPFVSTIDIDAGSLSGKGINQFRLVLTHELTHALMGAVQMFMGNERDAEGYASYVGDDNTSAYAKYKSFWKGLASKHGADKVREWGRLITDEWTDLWDKRDIPAAAFEQAFGKKY